MAEKKMVKDYQGKREYLVLSMVKKYPLYSLNKLAEELPEISRHSIQRILERNDLSTIEKRLAFSEEKRMDFSLFLKKLKTTVLGLFSLKQFDFEKLKNLPQVLREEPQPQWQLVRNIIILGLLVIIIWQAASFVLAKSPDISLEQPGAGFTNEGEKLFVSGRIIPTSSRITVNGKEVSLNGDGTFTAAVNIPLGESSLEVEAVNKRKKSRMLRLVNRVPTQEELQTQEETEAKKKLKAADKAAELERTVNDLMAAKSAVMNPESGRKGLLRVLNNHIEEEAGFSSVIGEVVNLGEEAVSWVMITAKFFNENGGAVDTKKGFATDFSEVIKPGERAEFETQATIKEFDYYSLELSWEEGAVAGIATEGAELKETTESGEIKEVE